MKANVPSAATHPNTFAWFVLVNRFSDAARNSWAAAQAAAPAKGGKAAPAKKEDTKKEEPKKEEPKKEAKPADDDMDLFGSDDEDDAVCLSMYLIVIINRLPRRLLRRLRRPTRPRPTSPSPWPSPLSSSR